MIPKLEVIPNWKSYYGTLENARPGECSPEQDYFTTELVALTEGLTVMMTSAQVIEAMVKMPQKSFSQLHSTG